MQNVKYLAMLFLGIVVGWFCQIAFKPSSTSINLSLTTPTAISLEHNDINPPLTAGLPLKNFKAQSIHNIREEQTPLSLIQELVNMDDQTYERHMHGLSECAQQYSDELLIGLLQELPTISDAKSKYRLIGFLKSTRVSDLNGQEHSIENWVVDRIKNGEQEQYWLEVAAEFGLESRANIEFLSNRLSSFNNSESRVSALLALSRGNDFDFFSQDDGYSKTSVAIMVSSSLNAADESVRAAAVRTLRSYPPEDVSERYVTALNDSSESVRVAAIQTLLGQNQIDNHAIKQSLLARMNASDASDTERYVAWEALKTLPLEGKYYSAVFDFGKNEALKLAERLSREAPRPRSHWQY